MTITENVRAFQSPYAEAKSRPLILAGRVRGARVYGRSGERLGSVEDVALDKRSGAVAHVLVAFGGILGFGRHLQALPWALCRYDPSREGYVTPCDRADLEHRPSFSPDQITGWSERPRARSADLYAPRHGFVPPF